MIAILRDARWRKPCSRAYGNCAPAKCRYIRGPAIVLLLVLLVNPVQRRWRRLISAALAVTVSRSGVYRILRRHVMVTIFADLPKRFGGDSV